MTLIQKMHSQIKGTAKTSKRRPSDRMYLFCYNGVFRFKHIQHDVPPSGSSAQVSLTGRRRVGRRKEWIRVFKKAITSSGVSSGGKVVMGLTFRLSASAGLRVTPCSHVAWPQGEFHPQLCGDENKLRQLQPWPIDFFFFSDRSLFIYFNLKEDAAFINIGN